ncbi:MAG TPA: carboxypeptidase regulatory-like domain-containing protein [Vicinamibacterales bacterium]|nr:carboxypeptidase regulatory-like domain-containing protein [Vicinamibacterales bacterium]
MKRRIRVVAVLFACLLAASAAFAQGGGASTTGSISGKISDSSGAVLPGVTVNASSASMMGIQTAVSDTGGTYRFPALPPGTYNLSYELPGFNTLKREGIILTMGFTANVNVELSVAAVQETVTVTGDSPVIDTSNTRVQQNFKLEALQEIPNARDMWSLLAVTPSVQMSRIDVGGNRAGTQTGYTAYGYSGQNRVLVEGINTTEGTSGAGFYFDYGSFEEVFLGTIAQGSEMPTPGVQSQFLGKSGGNRFQGEIYKDYERNSWQSDNIASNLPSQYVYNATTNPTGIRLGSNELNDYNDFNINIGGPIAKDKLWWYFSHRYQSTNVQQPNFIGDIAGMPFHTDLWNPSGKVTFQVNQNNKLIGYYQWGQKSQPNRLPSSSNQYAAVGPTYAQSSGSWVYKGEWNSTISSKMYAEVRYGVFGYYFPLVANTDTTAPQVINQQLNQYFNGDQKEQTDRHRGQITGAVTYFKDGWGGTHNLKIGGEFLDEVGYIGYLQDASGNQRVTINASGNPTTVVFYAPTATNVGGVLSGPHGELLNVNKLGTYNTFLSDQWSAGKATLNMGVRYDHYRSYSPDQQQLAYSFPAGVPTPALPATTFPETTYATFNRVAPRIGVSYDVFGTGRTVVKANYGLYWFNPGVGLASDGNVNQAAKSVTYNCGSCFAGQSAPYTNAVVNTSALGTLSGSSLSGAISVDPSLKDPYSNQYTLFLEQQLSEGVGAHVGFVLLQIRNQFGIMQQLRPASAYTVPFSFLDVGPDGKSGTADDATLTFLGIPNSAISGCTATTTTVTPTCAYPTNQVETNADNRGDYKTFEFAINKRQSHNYSLNFGAGYTSMRDYPAGGAPGTPNSPTCNGGPCDYSFYSAKGTGTYTFPHQIMASVSYRFQAGANYARTVSPAVPAANNTQGYPLCNCSFSASRQGSATNTTVYLTPYNAFRQDNISVLDVRAEKTFPIMATKVRVFFDVYNILNSYAAETINMGTGATNGVSNFQTPTAILGPRTGRIGFRFIW